MKEEIVQRIHPVFEELEKVITAFSEEQINIVPFENSWTAGQVADHIIKSLTGAGALLNGNTTTADRDPEQNVKPIADLFLNYEIKMKSPDFILPGNGPFSKNQLLTAIRNGKKEILDTINLDLNQLCLDFEFPNAGKFTRIEFLNFYNVHTERHTHQLKNIYSILNK